MQQATLTALQKIIPNVKDKKEPEYCPDGRGFSPSMIDSITYLGIILATLSP
jgi:hypothetical protein